MDNYKDNNLPTKNTRTLNSGLSKRCPLCELTHLMGLTKEEELALLEFRKETTSSFSDYVEKFDERFPYFNTFEREFIITGCCPDCIARASGTEKPEDPDRRFINALAQVEDAMTQHNFNASVKEQYVTT